MSLLTEHKINVCEADYFVNNIGDGVTPLQKFATSLSERNALMSHRGTGSRTGQEYSMKGMEYLASQGFPCIELDVMLTLDADENDQIFVVTHGASYTIEEYLPAFQPSPLLSTNYKDGFVATNNNATNFNEPAPSLKEAMDMLYKYDVAVTIEYKANAAGMSEAENIVQIRKLMLQLLAYPNVTEKVFMNDFRDYRLQVFKDYGFQTMKLINTGSTIPSNVNDWTYVCCHRDLITTLQASPLISQFFYFTVASPQEYQDNLDANSKLVGCFTDSSLPVLRRASVSQDNLNIMDPMNFYIATSGNRYTLNTGSRAEFADGRPQVAFEEGLETNTLTYTFQNKAFNMDFDASASSSHAFEVKYGGGDQWFGIVFGYQNYWLTQSGGNTFQYGNLYMHTDGRLNFYSIRTIGGSQSDVAVNSTPGGMNDFLTVDKYYIRYQSLDYNLAPDYPADGAIPGGPARLFECVLSPCYDADLLYGRFITNATNVTPIVITTSVNHDLANGAQINIWGVRGNTAANGRFVIQNVTATTFELTDFDGSNVVGNGTYTGFGRVTGARTSATGWSPGSGPVSGATNASPIQITSPMIHQLDTGDQITIADVAGNTAANGTWTITRIGHTTFTLDGSSGNGAYTPGTGFYSANIEPARTDEAFLGIFRRGTNWGSLKYLGNVDSNIKTTNNCEPIVYSGHVTSGAVASPLPSGWTVTQAAPGSPYSIQHSLGHTNYSVSITATAGVASELIGSTFGKGIATFSVYIFDDAGVATDAAFDVVVTDYNLLVE